jgi:hypothetical protein
VDIKKYKYESTLTFLIIMVSFDPSKYVNQWYKIGSSNNLFTFTKLHGQ